MTHPPTTCSVCRAPMHEGDRGVAELIHERTHECCDTESRNRPTRGRVLAVDDDAAVGATVYEVLSEWGYIVRTASGGTQALSLIPTFKPDVVLLDVMMSGLSGDEVLDRLHAEYPGIPVVMVTAIADAARARALLYRGAFDFIPKPFDLTVLQRAVDAAIVSRRS